MIISIGLHPEVMGNKDKKINNINNDGTIIEIKIVYKHINVLTAIKKFVVMPLKTIIILDIKKNNKRYKIDNNKNYENKNNIERYGNNNNEKIN